MKILKRLAGLRAATRDSEGATLFTDRKIQKVPLEGAALWIHQRALHQRDLL